jgi:hypothetical protein
VKKLLCATTANGRNSYIFFATGRGVFAAYAPVYPAFTIDKRRVKHYAAGGWANRRSRCSSFGKIDFIANNFLGFGFGFGDAFENGAHKIGFCG